MRTKLLATFLVMACASALAQPPQWFPTCPDGSVKFLFSASDAAIFIPGVSGPETAVEAGGFAGAVYPCNIHEWLPPKGQPAHIIKWQSGPWASGDYQTGTTTFLPGGELVWFVTSATHLPCSVTKPCRFKGVWESLSLTVRMMPDGSQVWSWWGSAVGAYIDAFHSKPVKNVRATYSQDSLNYNAPPLQQGQAWGASSLNFNVSGVL